MDSLFWIAKLAVYITCAGYLVWWLKPKGSFGGSGGGGTTTVTKDEIPQYIQDFSQENIQKAKDIANKPYEAYTGERVAGLTPEQMKGVQIAQNTVGTYQPNMNLSNMLAANAGGMKISQAQQSGGLAGAPGAAGGLLASGQPATTTAQANPLAAQTPGAQFDAALQQATGTYSNASNANFANADLSAYMNPYTQAVTQRAIEETQRAGAVSRNQSSGAITKAGGYGGARQGVVDAESYRNENQLIGDLAMQGNAAAFNNAMQGYGMDQQTRLAGAQGQANVYNLGLQNQAGNRAYDVSGRQLGLAASGQLAANAAQSSQQGYQDAAAMMDVGERQRQLQQMGLDVGYADYLNAQNYPIEMLNVLLSTQQGTPYSTSRTQNSTGGGTDNTGAIIGGVATVAGAAMMM